MNHFIEVIKYWWKKNGKLRVAVFAFLSPLIALPLAQVGSWAATQGQTSLPNWHTMFVTIGYAIVSAAVGWILKIVQLKKSFPTVVPVAPVEPPPIQ